MLSFRFSIIIAGKIANAYDGGMMGGSQVMVATILISPVYSLHRLSITHAKHLFFMVIEIPRAL